MHGLLIVDKPIGPTSTEVLRILGRRLGIKKLGHGGTLDPFASGVLPVLVGHATRLLPYLQQADKQYQAVVRIGVATDTLDCDGRITGEVEPPAGWTAERFCAEILPGWQGEIDQRVPAYAAVRVGGERLYEAARRGVEVERPVRRVTIHALQLLDWRWPELELRVHCSSGTYIRALGEELGRALGSLAHLRALRRLAVGRFTCEDALPPSALDRPTAAARLIPAAAAVAHLPAVTLPAPQVRLARNGLPLDATWVPPAAEPREIVRLLDPAGELLALAEVQPEPHRGLRVVRGFPAS